MLDPLAPDRVALAEIALRIDADGTIAERAEAGSSAYAALRTEPGALHLDPADLLLPGLTDLHIHAPQWPQRGAALDRPLAQWLAAHTFPLEQRYADLAYAESVYGELVPALLAQGTTTALYFATLHEPASLALARACLAHGQRGFVGLVAMDHPELCPPQYRHPDAAAAIAATRRFIDAVRTLPGNAAGLVQPVITPRFIPACTDALLAGLARLAAETGVRVQTHASESDWEHAHVLARCGCTDTEALDRFGLLRRHAVLAHGNFLDDQDLARIAAREAAVAHCPISNAFFADSVLPVRALLDRGVNCGLGTDIAGGFSPSIFDNARAAVLSARMLASGTDPKRAPAARGAGAAMRLAFTEALWLATRGGAQALGLSTGQLAPGTPFDAIELSGRGPVLRLDGAAEAVAQRIVCHASAAEIGRVWVAGTCVKA